MTADQMPPLPSPTFLGPYTADDIRAYARAYAEQQAAELRKLLKEARMYANDERLHFNENDTQKRGETRQAYEDRLSMWIERNEMRRDLLERIDEVLK